MIRLLHLPPLLLLGILFLSDYSEMLGIPDIVHSRGQRGLHGFGVMFSALAVFALPTVFEKIAYVIICAIFFYGLANSVNLVLRITGV